MQKLVVALVLVGLVVGTVLAGGEREEKLRRDRERVSEQGFWIYNDLDEGFAEARRTDRPLVVALRCVPCVECVKLDDDLVDTDPRLRPLLERFVRVRLISTNGLDLATFQFDTDQSFAVFLLRADGTIYGRYGTRSDRTAWADDVSIEGFAAALAGALEMHEAWPRDKEALAAKRGPKPPHATPERYPALRERFTPRLATDGDVGPSCIHCHMIGDADRAERLERGRLPDEVLFPHPHPKAIGLVLDPHRRALVKEVTAGTPAGEAGFRAGDEIRTLDGQPILSIADVQWVLHGVPAEGGRVAAVVARDEEEVPLTLALHDGWRLADDIAWRASTWPLRRIALGSMRLEPIPEGWPGLRVTFLGQNPPHDRAKRAGVRKGDVVVAVDGLEDLRREADVIRHALEPAWRRRGITLTVHRGDRRMEIRIPPE